MKKILILYTSVGLGHKFIANNIGNHLQTAGFEVKLADIYEVQKGWLISLGKILHHFINVNMPFVWSWLYKSEWFTNISLPWRVKVAGKNYGKAYFIIQEFHPDLIIATQAAASAVTSFLKSKGLYQGLFGIAFSDFHLHRYWLYDNCDFYLANIEEQKQEMINLGIPAEKIFVCGITLPPQIPVDGAAVRKKLGIAREEKVILVASGSQGIGLDMSMLLDLAAQPGIKVIVVCGKNKNIFEAYQKKFVNTNIIVLGFYTPMDELYAIANIFVTKPGGLTTTEALRWHLPIVVSHWLPGQEELNIQYLIKNNLVLLGKKELKQVVTKELQTENFRESLENNPKLQLILKPVQTVEKTVLDMTHPVRNC